MRLGTFFAPLTALALLGAGCLSLPTDTPEEPPVPDTPLGLLQAFEWCYDHQDEALYAEILDPDFTYILFPEQEYQGEDEIPMEWGRDEELARFADLCAACGEGDLDLHLDLDTYEEPGPDDVVWPIPGMDYDLRAYIVDTLYLRTGTADFLAATNEGDGPRWRLLELRGFERFDLN
jgi:hypothetical protein